MAEKAQDTDERMRIHRSTRRSGQHGEGGSAPGGESQRNDRPAFFHPTATDLAKYQELKKRRHSEITSMLSELSQEAKEKLLNQFMKQDPDLAFDLFNEITYPEHAILPRADPPPHWCTCSNCTPMSTDIENVCCGLLPQDCRSKQPFMDIAILDSGVLCVADIQRNEYLAGVTRHDNEARRHAAYRQFLTWRQGALPPSEGGPVAPSCVVLRIRSVYPSEDGTYSGFIPGRLV